MENKEELMDEYRKVTAEIEKIKKEELEPLENRINMAYEEIESSKNADDDRKIWSLYKEIYVLKGNLDTIRNGKLYELTDKQFKLYYKILSLVGEEYIRNDIEERRKKNLL